MKEITVQAYEEGAEAVAELEAFTKHWRAARLQAQKRGHSPTLNEKVLSKEAASKGSCVNHICAQCDDCEDYMNDIYEGREHVCRVATSVSQGEVSDPTKAV
jgi:hypothetical protein